VCDLTECGYQALDMGGRLDLCVPMFSLSSRRIRFRVRFDGLLVFLSLVSAFSIRVLLDLTHATRSPSGSQSVPFL
jgi:hypothetical protein